MRLVDGQLILAPTDLSTFLGCRHRTGLDLAVAHHALTRPRIDDPFADMLRERGAAHERQYVEALRARGLSVVTVSRTEGPGSPAALARQVDETVAAMRAGADAVVQGRLAHGRLAGYPDVLLRVERGGAHGPWSYEAQDTKLALHTKGAAILQLCAYSELLHHVQGVLPEQFHVVTPDPDEPVISFRTREYLAYYRSVYATLERTLARGHQALRDAHYPEPVDHCSICDWEARCVARRRRDDHLSFIAGAGRQQREELTTRGYATLASAAAMPVPVPFTPSRGARETYDRLGDQARVQLRQRVEQRPVLERLPIVPGEGLARLPTPSQGDVFLDLEGARFARDGGREFLFGLWSGGRYRGHWALNDAEEKHAFEETMDLIMAAWRADSGMHVYHFNHYEPTAFKRLVGRHVTRGEALDQLLRAERFVDLYPVVRQAVRCGVESYSLKQLEQYYGFRRQLALESVPRSLLAVELALESRAPESISEELRAAVQGYNEDDCRSTEALRDWLERLRTEAADAGDAVERPAATTGDPSASVSALQLQVEELRQRLLAAAGNAATSSGDLAGERPAALRRLAFLIDWHKREDNAQWWEYFRLKELPEDALLDESRALAGLTHVARAGLVTNKRTGKPTGSVIDHYAFPAQDVELRRGGQLMLQDGRTFGEVDHLDRTRHIVGVRKGPAVADVHPAAVFVADVVPGTVPQRAVMRLAEAILGGEAASCGSDLLCRNVPRLARGRFTPPAPDRVGDEAVELATHLTRTTLAIQGPPGAGKTHVGARMIRALVRAGRKVGVTATSHKVIRNLLDEVATQAAAAGESVRLGAKVNEASESPGHVREFEGNEEALSALGRDVDVLGGTAWLWSRDEAARPVDVLFVDEAGQMSLANALAVSLAADSLVLLGDPRQLEQPQKATHPEGVGLSALAHVLDGAETMPPERGLFLGVTHRMAPAIAAFTSELFYAGRLQAKAGLALQRLAHAGRYDGAGLWLVLVDHDGSQTSSPEEVDAVAGLVDALLEPAWTLTPPGTPAGGPVMPSWVDEHGVRRPLTGADLRVVAPFNAQVNRLTERLAGRQVPVGTVDSFQGQTAAIAIYSMTTSRPEDAPRGMEFLYSLNRLNVATSRARCAVFVVCSPHLLEPDCRTPRQMQLANALCRYRELARVVSYAEPASFPG